MTSCFYLEEDMNKITSNILRFDLNCIFSNSPRMVNRVFFWGGGFPVSRSANGNNHQKTPLPPKKRGGGDFLMLRKVMDFLQNNLVSNIRDRRLHKFATWILKIWIIFNGSVAICFIFTYFQECNHHII